MKILLRKDISHLGIVGDVVEVADGYARNYLVPQNLATTPTQANMRALAKERVEAEDRQRMAIQTMKDTASKLSKVEVTITSAANEDGVLYGSVGVREIAAALNADGHDVTPDQVKLAEPIRQLDNATVTVKLAEDITAEVKVWVVRPRGDSETDEVQTAGEEGLEADPDDQRDQ